MKLLRLFKKMFISLFQSFAVKVIPANWCSVVNWKAPVGLCFGSFLAELGSSGLPVGGTEFGLFTIMHLFLYVITSMDYPIARRTALRLLSMRNYHSGVLASKLERKGCSKEICERVIADCKRLGLIDDDQAILSQFRRGYGPRAIEYKLQLPRNEVRKVITREMQRDRMREMAPKLGEKEKAIRTLQRRGFDFDLIIEIFSLPEIH